MTTESSPFEQAGGWPGTLGRIVAEKSLTREQAYLVMSEILAGAASPAQIGGLLVGLAVKGESTDEMTGFAQAMLDASEPLSLPDDAVDIVGTGGSRHRRSHALNASTMACIVASAAGATICKHGNRRASSTSGSFDFLEALGVAIDLTPGDLERCVDEIGLGFAFARTYHPAMRFAGPVRAELGVPTVFNTLGPLAHPGKVKRQLVGVAGEEKAKHVAGVLHQMGSEHAWVVAGADGLDEVSTSGPTTVYVVTPEGIERQVIELENLGMNRVALAEVAGGTPEDNVAIFNRMMDGELGPHRDLVVINTGAALVVAGLAPSLDQGVTLASQALDSGATKDKLSLLLAFN